MIEGAFQKGYPTLKFQTFLELPGLGNLWAFGGFTTFPQIFGEEFAQRVESLKWGEPPFGVLGGGTTTWGVLLKFSKGEKFWGVLPPEWGAPFFWGFGKHRFGGYPGVI